MFLAYPAEGNKLTLYNYRIHVIYIIWYIIKDAQVELAASAKTSLSQQQLTTMCAYTVAALLSMAHPCK